MNISLDKFKKFIDIAGVNNDGFEINVSAGLMTANVMNNDRNVVLLVESNIEGGDDMKLRLQKDIVSRYLRNISSKVITVKADDTLITIEGGNVSITFPQIVPRVIDGTKKPLPDLSKWKDQAKITMTPSSIAQIISTTENLGEKIIGFATVGGKVTGKIRKTAILKDIAVSDVDSNFFISFHIGGFKDAFSGCTTGNASFVVYEETDQGRPPVSFAYINSALRGKDMTVYKDDILVSGLIAEWREKE